MRLICAKIAVASLLMSVALSACIVAPAPGYGDVVAYSEPPPPRYEVVGVAPTPGYFWVGGAWFWEGGRYGWHPGYWERPRPGYRWVPHTWRHEGGSWRGRSGHGHWERSR